MSRARVLSSVRPFSETRSRAYRSDHALTALLTAICSLLVTVTGLGIIGMSSYWVGLRRRQIGIKRALGASRMDILCYFLQENLLIASVAGACGIALGMELNLWLATHFEIARLQVQYIALGAVAILVLSQGAVLWPATRAASVPPATAARNATS